MSSARAGASHPLDSRHNWICFWILGTINNFGYVVVLSAAQSIAASYGASAYIGAINWADVGLGLVGKSVNAFFLEHVPTATRVWCATGLMVLGIIGLCFKVSFVFALLSISLIGLASAFGESVLLGYMKHYPVSATGAWCVSRGAGGARGMTLAARDGRRSSGTGMAGVGGSLTYLALHAAGVSNAVIFMILLPSCAVYAGVFWKLEKPSSHALYERLGTVELATGRDGAPPPQAAAATPLHETKAARVRRCARAVAFLAVNLALVYVRPGSAFALWVALAIAFANGAQVHRGVHRERAGGLLCERRAPGELARVGGQEQLRDARVLLSSG